MLLLLGCCHTAVASAQETKSIKLVASHSAPVRVRGDDSIIDEHDEDHEEEEETLPDCQNAPTLRLSGTVYDVSHPERSLAMFHTQGNERGAVYRAGTVVNAYELMAIGPHGVVLRDGHGRCLLRMAHVRSPGEPEPPRGAPATPAKSKPKRKPKK